MSVVKSLLSTRDLYNKFKPYLNKLRPSLSSYERALMAAIGVFYETFPEAPDLGTRFRLWFFTIARPNLTADEVQLYTTLIEAEDSPDTADIMYKALRERVGTEKLLMLCEEILSGNSNKSVDDIKKCVEELCVPDTEAEDRNVVSSSVQDLLGEVLGEGLDWKQVWMNQSCGPLRVGNFVALIARPDTGKTSFLCGQANAFAKQLPPGKVVLWCNNEQAGKAVKLRILQEATEMVNADMRRDGSRVEAIYKDRVGPLDKIVVVDMATLSRYDIEGYCKQYDVGAIIIDQLWKLRGCGEDISDVHTQTRIANWARELAKTVAPVIGVYQADAQAEGESYFGMDRIYMSKTAVQGECDLIICMGRSYQDGKEKSRFFHFPKNKLPGGGTYFQESMRSWKHETTFTSETGVVK